MKEKIFTPYQPVALGYNLQEFILKAWIDDDMEESSHPNIQPVVQKLLEKEGIKTLSGGAPIHIPGLSDIAAPDIKNSLQFKL